MTIRTLVAIGAMLALAACSGGDRPLHRLDAGQGGPDEFSVMPLRPLTLPDTFDLPEPTPGGANLTDVDARASAMAALGGADGAGPQGDAALLFHAGRHGSDPAIRATLAAEDAAFRRRSAGGFFNLLGNDRYFQAYARFALDARAELERFRALGLAVPSAPPGN